MGAHRRLRDDVRADAGGAPGAGGWLHESGGLECAAADDERERLLGKAARLRDWGYNVEVVDAKQVHALEPYLLVDGLSAATFCPDEAWVDGPAFAAGVCAAARRHGATMRSGAEVDGIIRRGERVTGVRLAGGEQLAAEWVVIAAGRWTDKVAALAGVTVPLAPTYGLLAVTGPLARRVNRVVHVPGMNFRPEPDGGLVLQSGATDAGVTAETAAGPGLPGCAELLERVQRFLPDLATEPSARIVEARVGIRPMPADGYSVVGALAERPGLYLAVTHSGVTLAPLLGELVAAEIITGREDERLATFRPGRLARLENADSADA
jgi:glycine/D-amino acid oxidase-like deaminating enzyme